MSAERKLGQRYTEPHPTTAEIVPVCQWRLMPFLATAGEVFSGIGSSVGADAGLLERIALTLGRDQLAETMRMIQ